MIMRYEKPPDGGWGWAATFTAFLAYAIAWGIPRGFSVLFQDFQSTFGSSNSQTSWITSLTGGFVLCGTLPGSAVNSIFGSRVTMMAGGIISCLGMILISQSTQLWMAYLGSMITGLGCGFAYCSGPSQIGIYFDKNRSLAFSIASIGSPANSILMPLLFVYLSELYSWRGALLVTAGICLHLTVGGALLRPVSICEGYNSSVKKQKEKIELSLSFDKPELDEKNRIEDHLLSNEKENRRTEVLDIFQNPNIDRMGFLGGWSKSTLSLHFCEKHNATLSENFDSISLPVLFDTGGSNKWHEDFQKKILTSLKTSGKNLVIDEEDSFCLHRDGSNSQPNEENLNHLITSNVVSQTLHKPSDVDSERSKVLLVRLQSFIRPYLSLLTQWRFMIYCVVGCLDYHVRLTPASFIVVHAQTQGLTKDEGALLLVIFAVMDTCIRPISGLLTNRLPQQQLRQGIEILAFGSAEFLMALLNFVAPMASKFWTLSIYMSLYGVANGLNSSWCFSILSRLVPVEFLQHAVGIFHFCCSIGFLSGPPLAGYLADVTGHYYAIFYFAGTVIFLAGMFAWILFYLTRKKGIRAATAVSVKTP